MRAFAVLLLVGAAVGLTFGVKLLRARAAEVLRGPAGRVDGAVVEVGFDWPEIPGSGGQTWLPDRDQAELIRAAERAAGDADPLGVGPLRDVSEAMNRTGWFRSSPRVRVVGSGRLHVSPEWRQPAAVVRWQGRDHLVSMNAEPMPPVYRPGGSNRPVILGCSQGPGGRNPRHTPWPGMDVHSGLDLLKTLWSAGVFEQVDGIDVSAYRDGGPLEIVTTHGTRVVWGSAPDEWKAGEPSVEERVRRLKKLMEASGRIDGGQQRIEIHRARVEIDRTGDD